MWLCREQAFLRLLWHGPHTVQKFRGAFSWLGSCSSCHRLVKTHLALGSRRAVWHIYPQSLLGASGAESLNDFPEAAVGVWNEQARGLQDFGRTLADSSPSPPLPCPVSPPTPLQL